MLKCLKFSCFGEVVYLITDCDRVYDFYFHHIQFDSNDKVLFLDELFPGIVVSEDTAVSKNPMENDYVVCLCFGGKEFNHIDAEKNFAIISTNEKNLNVRDINVLLSTMIAKKLNLSGKSFLHCSIVEKYGEATVILGDMGAGKTSLAVFLCRYFGYKLLCNDHAVIGIRDNERPYVYGGTLTTILRPGAAKLVIPDLLNIIPDSMFKNPWQTQFVLNDFFDSIGVKVGESAYIRNVVFISIAEGIPCDAKKIPIDKRFNRTLVKLCQNLGEFSRSHGKFLFGINRVLPSFDNDETNNNRRTLALSLSNNAKIYEVRGNIKAVSDFINEINT